MTNASLTWLMAAIGLGSIENVILIALRLTGLLGVGAFLGHPFLTWRVRISLIVLLTLIVAPTLPSIPEGQSVIRHVSHEIDLAGEQIHSSNEINGADTSSISVESAGRFALLSLSELVLGATMGLGAIMVLSGLRLGGEWLDRHSGLGMGSLLNPEFLSEGSAPAGLTLLFGVAAILLMEPLGAHLILARTMLDTFRSLPVGKVTFSGSMAGSLGEFLIEMLRLSFLLGLRVAMPFVVAMSLVEMTFGFLNRSSTGTLAPVMLVARSLVAMLLLVAAWPGIAESVSTAVLDAARNTVEPQKSGSS